MVKTTSTPTSGQGYDLRTVHRFFEMLEEGGALEAFLDRCGERKLVLRAGADLRRFAVETLTAVLEASGQKLGAPGAECPACPPRT